MKPETCEMTSEKIESLVTHFKSRQLDELQLIKPLWACGGNFAELLDFSLLPENNEYFIHHILTANLIQKSEFYGVDTSVLFNGASMNDNRIAKILFQWENKKFIDPPTIAVCLEFKGKVCFSDGRHRTKIAHLLKYKTIPVAIHHTQINQVKSILKF